MVSCFIFLIKLFYYNYFKSRPISRQISNCLISDVQSMLVQSDVDFEKVGSAVTDLKKVPFKQTGLGTEVKLGPGTFTLDPQTVGISFIY